jgi:hypothetical protein
VTSMIAVGTTPMRIKIVLMYCGPKDGVRETVQDTATSLDTLKHSGFRFQTFFLPYIDCISL